MIEFASAQNSTDLAARRDNQRTIAEQYFKTVIGMLKGREKTIREGNRQIIRDELRFRNGALIDHRNPYARVAAASVPRKLTV